MRLAELQREFRAWLVTSSIDAATRLGVSVEAGLSVYQNNYRAQLMGCLAAIYPEVRRWMDEEAFRVAAMTHIDSHPPRAWTLDAYGHDFGETLAALHPDNPDVHELAWIECALSEAFIAPDAEPLPLETLSAIDWDSARLRLAPSFMSHVATTNAERIWSALKEGETPPEGEMLEEPAGLIVWRRRFSPYLKQVDALEREALLHLRENGSFAALCAMLVERLGETDGVSRGGAMLADWLHSELVIGVDEA